MQEREFEIIKEQVREVIAYSQSLPLDKINVDELMSTWKVNKFRFYNGMPGKQLIYQSPEEIVMPVAQSDLDALVVDFIDTVYWHYKIFDLGEFIEHFKADFFNNIITEDYPYKGYVIPKGMKIIKAYKYFIEDKDLLHIIQDKASMIIQNTKISGYFCLSVHPLDYLSLSENNHNWRSCHALDGEYRAGNLSYMADGSTIVCYIKSKDDTILPRFPSTIPWNNKKWRMLIHVSNDWNILISGRNYPYISKGLEDYALKVFRELFEAGVKYTDWNYDRYSEYKFNDDVIFTERMIPAGTMVPARKMIMDATNTPLHYNDPLHSTVYKFHFSERYNRPAWFADDSKEIILCANNETKVVLGNEVKCCICGKNECVLSETMLCIDCELEFGTEESDDFTYCADCGRRIYIPEAVDTELGYYCQDCGQDYSRCYNCNELYKDKDLIYDEETDAYYCEQCYDEIISDREQEENE